MAAKPRGNFVTSCASLQPALLLPRTTSTVPRTTAAARAPPAEFGAPPRFAAARMGMEAGEEEELRRPPRAKKRAELGAGTVELAAAAGIGEAGRETRRKGKWRLVGYFGVPNRWFCVRLIM